MMERIGALALGVAALMVVSGCGQREAPLSETSPAAERQAPGTGEPAGVGDSQGTNGQVAQIMDDAVEDDAEGSTADMASVEAPQAPAAATHASASSPRALPAVGDEDARIISFDDLVLGLQPDQRFRPFMLTDRTAQELIGQRVNISGYMLAGDRARGIEEFVLLRNTECKFGPGGQADHLVHVKLNQDVTTSFTNKVIYVEGVLLLNPYEGPDGNTWSIYDLAGERVSTTPPR